METAVYLGYSNIRCALGNSTKEVFERIMQGDSGVKDGFAFLPERYASVEDLVIPCIEEVLRSSGVSLQNNDTLLVISTTKGNVHLLGNNFIAKGDDCTVDCFPGVTARKIAANFNAANEPIVISNACISGISALIIAKRLIASGQYSNVVVAGVDLLSPFIIEGFASFKSLSAERCRPYDASHCGLNLGEGCGVVLLTDDSHRAAAPAVAILGGSISNDANHISGPSRTGDGLFYAMDKAARNSGILLQNIDFINAHGTSTVYNDQMESKAVHWAGLDNRPLNSLKPYFGHTLGAAGVIETILTAEQIRRGVILGTAGYNENGVPFVLNVAPEHRPAHIRYALKTASGFGGCNAALVLAAGTDDVGASGGSSTDSGNS
ncbi:MAG: beta-ketoacyl synthase, partial [Bacteroidales bacterium]|nr:beta-ketoacyl synthase [Bacteroidales bacterium]